MKTPPAYIKKPDQIADEMDAFDARCSAPGYKMTERDISELAKIYKSLSDYYAWLIKNGG